MNHTKSPHWLPVFGLLAVLFITISGCGGGTAASWELIPVRGQVTLDGNPLPGASVTFLSSEGRISVGTTDSEGRYQLVSSTGVEGVVAGQQRVEISASKEVPGKTGSEGEPLYEQLVPARYNHQTTLSAEITAPRDDVNFELKSK